MLTIPLACSPLHLPSLYNKHLLSSGAYCHHHTSQLKFSANSISVDHFRFSAKKTFLNKNRRGSSAVCNSSVMNPSTLQWVSSVASVVLLVVQGAAIQKPFLVPFFALQAPSTIISWIKGDYGIWTAFVGLFIRLFFRLPGELELPIVALLVIIIAPHQVMNLRGRLEGVIISLLIAAYLAFQHFSRVGSLRRAFDQVSVVATLAIVCIITVPCLLLFSV
jgi:hypothetical protein